MAFGMEIEMTDSTQPEALRLAELLELAPEDGVEPQTTEDAAAELRRQHTENTALQQGYAAAQLEIESLQARIKTMAEEHADELMVAHLDGMRAAQPAGAQQPGDCGNTPYDEGPFTLAQQPGAATWTPLPGTLPEPGTPVLLDIGKKYPIRAMWAAKHTVPAADDDTDWGEYDEATDQYWCPEGWYEWNQNEDNHWQVSETPRAWMPIPPPPTTSAGSKGE